MAEINIKKKICLIGDSGVGKTSLIRKYVYDLFDDKYIPTIGTKVTEKTVAYQKGDTRINLKLMIWDILGQELFTNVRRSAYLGSSGAIAVCDISRAETVDNLKNWVKGFQEVVGEVPIVLIANKIDLIDQVEFDKDTLKIVAGELGAPYYFTSAKTGKNVNEVFVVMGEMLARNVVTAPTPVAAPPEKEEVEKEIKDIYTVMDQIVDGFCTLHGGHERAMPIIQEQCKLIGFDFANPTVDGLKKLVEKLASITELYSSPEYAEKEKLAFLKLIEPLEAAEKVEKVEKAEVPEPEAVEKRAEEEVVEKKVEAEKIEIPKRKARRKK